MSSTNDFIDLKKADVVKAINEKKALFCDIPSKYSKAADKNIRGVSINGKFAPFLSCKMCSALFQWYKFDNGTGTWKNQSVINSIQQNLTKKHVSSSNAGSDFALAAAALCGFDLVEKIESLTTDVCNTAPKVFKAEAKVWKRAWIEAAKNIDNRIIRYIESLLFIYYPERIVNSEVADSDGFGRDCSSSAAGFKPHKDNILDDMLNPPDAKKQKRKFNNFAEELKHFQGLGLCLKDPVSFFSRIGDEFLMLKRVAKILLSIPVSSAMDRAAVQ